jgi:hypothetical protein
MTLKYMKIPQILVLCIIMAFMAVPAVSAKTGTAGAGKNVNKATTVDYIVSPATESSPKTGNPVMVPLSTQYLSKGQTITHGVSITSATVKYLEVDLNWGVASKSLALTAYTPSGTNLGTYHDNYDGKVLNGRIRLNIYPSSKVYIEKGNWKFKVYGESVSGTQSYTFNTYAHY